jgi:hypothetical protein
MSKLSAFFIEKAKNELGEDEDRKRQALQQLNEFVKNHPFVKFREISKKNRPPLRVLFKTSKFSFNVVRRIVEPDDIASQKIRNGGSFQIVGKIADIHESAPRVVLCTER